MINTVKNAVNDRLAEWIKRRAETEFPQDISVVAIYGSHVNGASNPKSDLDCFFIPKTDRGYGFCLDFIINGVGYDIFPIEWERAEGMSKLYEPLLPLIGDSKLLYCASEEDRQRFEALREQLKANLADSETSKRAAHDRLAKACSAYGKITECTEIRGARSYAGELITDVADAAALFCHDYYHYGLKKQYDDLCGLTAVPAVISEEYAAIIRADSTAEITARCKRMLDAACGFTVFTPPPYTAELEEPFEALETDFAELAKFYEELSSAFNKVYVCCENGNYILAFISAVCLQHELDNAHKYAGTAVYDLMSCFDYRNLGALHDAAANAENSFVAFIENGGGKIKRFDGFEDFEKKILAVQP